MEQSNFKTDIMIRRWNVDKLTLKWSNEYTDHIHREQEILKIHSSMNSYRFEFRKSFYHSY